LTKSAVCGEFAPDSLAYSDLRYYELALLSLKEVRGKLPQSLKVFLSQCLHFEVTLGRYAEFVGNVVPDEFLDDFTGTGGKQKSLAIKPH